LHLLGMWSQQWNNIYDDLLKLPAGIETAIASSKPASGTVKMTLVESFIRHWASRSCRVLQGARAVRPGIAVVCRERAWDMDPAVNDVRIRCAHPDREDLFRLSRLGHVCNT
jgi:hypothetical protein